MNRVASAVGEGSMMVRFAHEYLALTLTPIARLFTCGALARTV